MLIPARPDRGPATPAHPLHPLRGVFPPEEECRVFVLAEVGVSVRAAVHAIPPSVDLRPGEPAFFRFTTCQSDTSSIGADMRRFEILARAQNRIRPNCFDTWRRMRRQSTSKPLRQTTVSPITLGKAAGTECYAK